MKKEKSYTGFPGGAKAPEFKEKLKAGLNPKTSLAGMTGIMKKVTGHLNF